LFASSNGVSRSSNDGLTWDSISDGLLIVFNDSYLRLDTVGGALYVGNGRYGIWSRALSEIVTDVRIQDRHSASSYLLMQNYTSSFNPSTTLRYSLPSRSRVTLQVYSLFGQAVADLVNTEQAEGRSVKEESGEGEDIKLGVPIGNRECLSPRGNNWSESHRVHLQLHTHNLECGRANRRSK
jgi:hypothetical protein